MSYYFFTPSQFSSEIKDRTCQREGVRIQRYEVLQEPNKIHTDKVPYVKIETKRSPVG